MTVHLDATAASAIHAHARSTYPEECCGALIGGADDRNPEHCRVLHAVALENEATSGRERAFLISSRQSLACTRLAAALGLDVVGFYHSHPDHPAVPSRTDRALGWPGYCFVITTVDRDGVGPTRAWQLQDDASRFAELPLDISGVVP